MRRVFAELVAGLAGVFGLALFLPLAVIRQKWRASLLERIGFGNWLVIAQELPRPIWVHVASVGELVGVYPVLQALRAEFPTERLLITTTSTTGKAEVLKRDLADGCAVLPFDNPLTFFWLLRRVRPRVLIIAETELWPNFLFAANRANLRTVLVNGRISDYTVNRYRAIRFLVTEMLACFSRILVQTELDRSRFIELGAAPELVLTVGSSKYDQPAAVDAEQVGETIFAELGLRHTCPILVAGSVRPGEDEAVCDAFLQIRSQGIALKLLIAPRHPERFDAVAELLTRKKIAFSRRSNGGSDTEVEVALLDTLGELRFCYAAGDLSFVGGSLVNIGGHNPLEPASFRKPVIVGPHTSTVRDAVAAMRDSGGIVEVTNSVELAHSIRRLLDEPAYAHSVADAGYAIWKLNLGATERILTLGLREH